MSDRHVDDQPAITDDILREAVERFESLYRRAREASPAEASVMTLATTASDGQASVRTMSFTGLIDGRLTFFANRLSGKGLQLSVNPRAGLCFYWPAISQQIVVEGSVIELPDDRADELWKRRPRPAALVAWASRQSRESAGEPGLKERIDVVRDRYADERLPRPPDWLGYGVQPHRIDFWHGGWEGHQERDTYRHTASGWQHRKLNP